MKTKLLIGALVAIIGFASCGTEYYATGQTSPHRSSGYRKDSDGYQGRDGYYYRGGYERATRRNQMRGYRGW